jgi:hypothetical protein
VVVVVVVVMMVVCRSRAEVRGTQVRRLAFRTCTFRGACDGDWPADLGFLEGESGAAVHRKSVLKRLRRRVMRAGSGCIAVEEGCSKRGPLTCPSALQHRRT